MYFILKTLKGYILSFLTLVACIGLLSSVAALALIFLDTGSFTLDELLLAPSQLPMGQGLQQIRTDIIQEPSECARELELFTNYAGRNCVLIEYVSNTSQDKLNDFHFMQTIKINYWLFDTEADSGSFYQSLLENPVSLPLTKTKDQYLSLSYNFSLMAENYSVFYYDSSVVQSKQHQQVPIHGLTILQEGTVVVEILVQGFLRNHSPWLGLHWLHRLSDVAVLHVTSFKPGPVMWLLKSIAGIQETVVFAAAEHFITTFPWLGAELHRMAIHFAQKVSAMEIKEISEYGDKWDNIARLFIVSIVILIVHKVQMYYVSFEEEQLSLAKCEAMLTVFTCRNRRVNTEVNKVSLEG